MILSKNTVNKILNEIEKVAEKDGESLVFELEKLVPHPPIKVGVDIYKEYILDQYACPKCARRIGDEMLIFKYCPNCGQRIEHD